MGQSTYTEERRESQRKECAGFTVGLQEAFVELEQNEMEWSGTE